MENTKHNLESGDSVCFREVVGMSAINGTTHKVKGIELDLSNDIIMIGVFPSILCSVVAYQICHW